VLIQREMLTVQELVRAYSTARVALVPSFFEGFGFPASEAMACGLAVIANAAGALPEVIGTDGVAGRLVPQRNATAMAQAMKDVLADPERTAQMGRDARKRVQQTFQWKDAAANLVDLFEDTLRAAHSRSRAA
jgi:glycosyltransferase involved in cell wall biosynthesis